MKEAFKAFGFVILGVFALIRYGGQYFDLFSTYGRSEEDRYLKVGYNYIKDRNLTINPENSLVSTDALKELVIKLEARKHLNSLYPEADFSIKNISLLSEENNNEKYDITVYIDDATTDTIFYQYEITIAKIDTENLVSEIRENIYELDIIEHTDLKLKAD